ncbi:MAG: hypothetical protein AseanaTS_20860 [Candidatus Pelagadaptatus aseana]|uniref:DUF748 domain-containing protein n=1 Tax=Candidatus Pelagadaptatus aseana TaxID=3120508 RepID=UPI0039B1E8A2
MPGTDSTFSRRLLRWGGHTLLLIFLILLLVFTLLPLGIRTAVEHWFAQQGIEAELAHVEIAPVVGRVQLSGLKALRNGERVLQLDDLIVDISWLPLRENRLQITEFSVDGLYLQASKRDNQQWLAGLNLEKLLSTGGNTPNAPDSQAGAEADASASPFVVEVDRLALENIGACANASSAGQMLADYCLDFRSFNIPQTLSLVLDKDISVQLPGAQLQQLAIKDQLPGQSVLRLGAITMQQLQLQADTLTLANLSLESLQVLAREASLTMVDVQPYYLSLQAIGLQDMAYSLKEPRADLESLSLAGLGVMVHRDSNGVLPIQPRVNALQQSLSALLPAKNDTEQPQPQADPSVAGQEGALVLTLNQFSLGQGSRVFWLDEGVQPQVKQTLNDVRLAVQGIDTSMPQHQTEIDFAVALNDFSSASLKGWVKPFTEKVNLAFDARIEGFDALPVSPYVERNLQYKIQQGHINETLTVAIEEDQLDIMSELVLEKFYMESLSRNELAEGEETQDLPVAMALDLLRDGDDRITVEIPVDGDISDPNFSLAQVMGVVFRKALTQAVINYYTPFGLVNIASAVAGSAMKLRFDPFYFPPGNASLTSEQMQRLKELSGLLTSKQQLSLSFCPKVTAQDAMSMLGLKTMPKAGLQLTDDQIQQLLLMGKQRSVAIKRALLDQQVRSSQVILCQVELDLGSVTEPFVTVQI